MDSAKFEIWRHWLSRQWRWRLIATNGRIIAVSSESYHNKIDVQDAVAMVRNSGTARIVVTD